MRPSYLYTLLFSIVCSTAVAADNGSCIADDEVQGIAQRWLNAFATGGIGGLPEAVTPDVRR